ncbi:MAG: hypothetical protein H6883_10485 [Rhodobiaceae bacterium]|nr:hypothetical protein [Rhodobiaceae bacterium]
MRFSIEFYRTRAADDALATVARETVIVSTLSEAIEVAMRLSTSLNMPQRPDAMSIIDGDGCKVFSKEFDPIDAS